MGFHSHGGTDKWMVCNGNPIKIDDLGVLLGTPISGNPEMVLEYPEFEGESHITLG